MTEPAHTRRFSFSRWSLRAQLLASYVLLLLMSLCVISVSFIAISSSRPAPTEQTFQRLSVLLQGLTAGDTLRDLLIQRVLRDETITYRDLFNDFSTNYDVRLVYLSSGWQERQVIYDSDGTLASATEVSFDSVSYLNARLQRALDPRLKQIFGTFTEDGQEWVFAGIQRTPFGQGSGRNQSNELLLVAEPRPTVSLQGVLNEFSSSLLPVLLQAGAIGLLIAFGFAVIISRSIVRPLRALADGAIAVARGDYEQTVPQEGPTEVRKLAGVFNRMSGDVRAAQQSQRDFIANVSHDLKTPLTSIQGYSQAIVDEATPDPKQAANVINEEAARLNRMVVELTDLMRMQSGHLSLNTQRLDVSQIAGAVGERLRMMAVNKKIELHTSIQPVPEVSGDGDRLAQVIMNLLSNAIKFTPSGGDIYLTVRPANGGVEISVRDTGIGIPPSEQPRIFERFYQIDKARGPRRGTGLGLAISKEIVSAHGGEMHVRSDGEGEGTEFIVWLPAESPPPRKPAAERIR